MDVKRYTGPQAGVQKYDLLTALSVIGLRGSATERTSMLRLIALVTARYNWRTDELTVGQKEMAKLWAIDQRSGKREIKRLTTPGYLLQLRPGQRGRVAAYRLNQPLIGRLSAASWLDVGPDFEARMGTRVEQDEPKNTVVRVDFPSQGKRDTDTPWGRVLERLEVSDPGLFRNWYANLAIEDVKDGTLRVRAPSAFVAQYVDTHHLGPLRGAAELEFGPLKRIVFI